MFPSPMFQINGLDPITVHGISALQLKRGGDYPGESVFNPDTSSYAFGPWIMSVSSGGTGLHDHALMSTYNCRYNQTGAAWERVADGEHAARHAFESRYVAVGDPGAVRGLFEWNLDICTSTSGAITFPRRPWFLSYDFDNAKTALRVGASEDTGNMTTLAGAGHSLGIGADPTAPLYILSSESGASYRYAMSVAGSVTSTNQHAYGLSFGLTLAPGDTKDAVGIGLSPTVSIGNGKSANGYGVYIAPVAKSGAGTLTSLYGLYIGAQAAGSTNWGIYCEGSQSYINGNLGIGTNAPTAPIDIYGDTIRVRYSNPPANAGAVGNKGNIVWDSGFIYICVDTNTWKRATLATW
jgi:hypothetical protein